MDAEEATVRAFVLPHRRDRWISGLASAKRRGKITGRLAHCPDLDPRYAHHINAAAQATDAILADLVRRKAPTSCWVISENSDLDGREMALTDALERIVGEMSGSIVVCRPGKLAYYEGEEPGERYILERS